MDTQILVEAHSSRHDTPTSMLSFGYRSASPAASTLPVIATEEVRPRTLLPALAVTLHSLIGRCHNSLIPGQGTRVTSPPVEQSSWEIATWSAMLGKRS